MAATLCDPAAFQRIAPLRDRMEAALLAVAPVARVAGAGGARVANTTCLITPGLPADTQLMALDLAGVAVSSGSACSSGKVAPSHVLSAMGVPADQAGCAIRVSLGWTTTAADVDTLVASWTALYRRRPG